MANIVNKKGQLGIPQQQYDTLIERSSNLWSAARNRAAVAVNTELLNVNNILESGELQRNLINGQRTDYTFSDAGRRDED